tara:strand:+ start:191 stop:427 length:237 start_codon:yes stop_codon:yes gene_type:complete
LNVGVEFHAIRSWYFSSRVGVGSTNVSILSELSINASSFVIPFKNGSKVILPSKGLTQKALVNWQSGSPGTAAGVSSI